MAYVPETIINNIISTTMCKTSLITFFLLLCSALAFAQNPVISGTVIDQNGDPIVGASVYIAGTKQGTSSDPDGKFSIQAGKGTTLVISSIGYVSQEFTVGDSLQPVITLTEDAEFLESVVVIGYGSVKKENFTGSVATYKIGEGGVSNMGRTNALDMLRGLAPGVSFSQSGVVGSSPSIQIRGQKSISGESDPLLVLDGVIYLGTINDLDPNIIESISVMKDATSLAAYGSQAANGVIMITTKKAAEGKTTLNFRASVGLSEMNYIPTLLNGEEFIELVNARQNYPAGTTTWMDPLEASNYQAGKEIDWLDYMTQVGVSQDYSLNVSGGSTDFNYLIGASYTDQGNFIIGNNFVRESVTARVNTKIQEYLSLGLNVNWANTETGGLYGSYNRFFSPYGSPTLEDGVTMRKYIVGPTHVSESNPLWDVYNGVDSEIKGNAATLGGNITLQIPFIKGLSYKITGNYTLRNTENNRFYHEKNFIEPTDTEYTTETFDKYLSKANGYNSNSKYVSWVLDNILTYEREFGDHDLNATFVYTRDYNKNKFVRVSGTGFTGIGNTTLGFYGLNNADTQKYDSIDYVLHTDVGYLARINYSYLKKYHFNASVRRDGSSVFGSDRKWGVFPAFGVAWTLSNEPFLRNIAWIDYLKVKASWGKNGNQALSPYGTLSRMSMGKSGGYTAYFNDLPVFGESMTSLGNAALGWETTTSWNTGFETDILSGRIHWELDAYKSKTTDQIFERTIPVMGAGITKQSSTMGRVDNWGIESSMRGLILQTKDFNWDATLSFTLNRNILKDLYGDGQDDIVNSLFLGKSLGAIYGRKLIGIVQETDTAYMEANGVTAGDPKYANIDNSEDGRITDADRMILGYRKENFRMSLATNFSWKKISLYALFNGIFSGNGYGVEDNSNARVSYSGMLYKNMAKHPFWTPENKSNTYPNAQFVGTMYAIEPYGFVRLQDLSISYNLDTSLVKKMGISHIQLYLSGHNLFFIAPGWKLSDPEVRDCESAQLARTYTLGLNVKF